MSPDVRSGTFVCARGTREHDPFITCIRAFHVNEKRGRVVACDVVFASALG